MSVRVIQDLHSGISRRDWKSVELAADRLRDDVNLTISVLAGESIGSLPNDYPLHRIASERVSEIINTQKDEINRLREIEWAVKRLAFVVRKSVNSGPLSIDPTAEANAWRAVRVALGEGYDEKGNLVPVVG